MLLLSIVIFLTIFGVLFFYLKRRFLSGRHDDKPRVSPEAMARSLQTVREITSRRSALARERELEDGYDYDKRFKVNQVHPKKISLPDRKKMLAKGVNKAKNSSSN